MSTKSCHLICKIDLNNNNYNYLSIYSLHAVEFTSIMYMFYVYYASTYNGRRLSQNISSSHGFTVFMPHFNHQSRYIATAGIVIFSIVLLNTVTGLICHSHWSSFIAKATKEEIWWKYWRPWCYKWTIGTLPTSLCEIIPGEYHWCVTCRWLVLY